jgi:hypothetical protein
MRVERRRVLDEPVEQGEADGLYNDGALDSTGRVVHAASIPAAVES